MVKPVRYIIRREILEGLDWKPFPAYLIFDREKGTSSRVDKSKTVEFIDGIINFSHVNGEITCTELLDKVAQQLAYIGAIHATDSTSIRLFNHKPQDHRLASPFKIYLNISEYCPFSCFGCMNKGGSADQLEKKTVFRLIDEISEMGVPYVKIGSDFFFVNSSNLSEFFSVEKPERKTGISSIKIKHKTFYPIFDHPNNYFFDVAEKLRANGALVSTSITGVGVSQQVVQKMKELEIKVSVSLDAGSELSRMLRPDTYELAIYSLDKFTDGGYPAYIGMTLYRQNANANELKKVIDIATKHNAKGLKLRIGKPKGYALDRKITIPREFYLPNQEIAKMKEVIKNSRENGINIDFEDLLDDPVNVPVRPYLAHPEDCGTARKASIRPNGVFRPCSFLPPEYKSSTSIYEGKRLLEMWQTDPVFIKAGLIPDNNPSCPECNHYAIHHGDCRAVQLHEFEQDGTPVSRGCLLHRPN
jgi:radical SAM protein with 4Fe4S-binding SPASM domain